MVESKDFRRQAKECMAVFFKMCEKCYRKSCSICVMNLQGRNVKKKKSTLQNESFEHNGMKRYDLQRLESLEEKKAAHMQTWCQKDLKLHSKGRPASKLT